MIHGIGSSLVYVPAIGVIPLWFRNKNLGLAVGIGAAGSGVGGTLIVLE